MRRPKLWLPILFALLLAVLPVGRAAAQSSDSASVPAALQPLVDTFNLITTEYAGKVDQEALVRAAIDSMLQRLGDTHSQFFSAADLSRFTSELAGTYEGLGIEITSENGDVKVLKVFAGSPAEAAGLQAGDVIVSADGVNLHGRSLEEASLRLKGPKGSRVVLVVARDGQDRTMEVKRGVVALPSVHVQSLTGDLTYVQIDQFNANTGEQFMAAWKQALARKTRGLLLDLRNNPGGYVSAAVEIGRALVAEGPIVRIVNAAGKEDDVQTVPHPAGPPIVVLVNGNTASAAEIVAGALQDNGATLVGTQTYGKGSVQSLLPLPGGAALKLTTAHYLTPKGRAIDGVGLKPDVVVPAREKATVAFDPWGTRTLRYGLQGPDVSALQERLTALHYPVDAAGYFGGNTLRSLMLFELAQGLPMLQEVTASVRQALDRAATATTAKETQTDPQYDRALEILMKMAAASGN